MRGVHILISLATLVYSSAQDGITIYIQGQVTMLDCSTQRHEGQISDRNPKGTTTSPSSNLVWHTVGLDRFVRFDVALEWENGRDLCHSHGLDLYKPIDIHSVALYLKKNFSTDQYWLGARGNGTHQVWLSDSAALNQDDPWYRDLEYGRTHTHWCMFAYLCCDYPKTGAVLGMDPCDGDTFAAILCA